MSAWLLWIGELITWNRTVVSLTHWCARMKSFEVTLEDGTVLSSKLATNSFPKPEVRHDAQCCDAGAPEVSR